MCLVGADSPLAAGLLGALTVGFARGIAQFAPVVETIQLFPRRGLFASDWCCFTPAFCEMYVARAALLNC